MTIEDALSACTLPKEEKEILLAHALQKDRSYLFAHSKDVLPETQQVIFTDLSSRRMLHEPLAHLVGYKEFFGRNVRSDRRAFIPRSCTEALVGDVANFLKHPRDAIKEIDPGIVSWTHVLKNEKPELIADIGTGTGCMAITLALEHPNIEVIATDASEEALSLAKENAVILCADHRVNFLLGDLLEPLAHITKPFLIVSNPPYLALESSEIEREVLMFEPHQSLFAEDRGRAIVEKLTKQATAHPACVGWILECPIAFVKT